MLEEFRELVRAGILRVTPENEVLPVKPSNAGEQPTQTSREEDVALLDKQLLEWMERRREQKSADARRRAAAKPAEPASEALPAGIREKVVERLAQKILESWDRAEPVHQSLREQVVDRVAEDILRRWQRSLE
jgi:hypothetical protein